MTTTHDAPTIICPPWCDLTSEEHLADLPVEEGFVRHSHTELSEEWQVRVEFNASPDGTPEPGVPAGVMVDVFGGPLGERSAKELAWAIARFADLAARCGPADAEQIQCVQRMYRSRAQFEKAAEHLGVDLDHMTVDDVCEMAGHSNQLRRLLAVES